MGGNNNNNDSSNSNNHIISISSSKKTSWGDENTVTNAVVVEDKRAQLKRAASSLEVPDSFLCPITCCVMEDPVTLSDGHTYEKAAINRWLSDHNTSPLTGATLGNKMFVPNHALRNAIDEV